MSNHKTALRIVTKTGAYILTVLPDSDIQVIVRDWANGTYKLNGPAILKKTDLEGMTWAIETNSIEMMNTVKIVDQSVGGPNVSVNYATNRSGNF